MIIGESDVGLKNLNWYYIQSIQRHNSSFIQGSRIMCNPDIVSKPSFTGTLIKTVKFGAKKISSTSVHLFSASMCHGKENIYQVSDRQVQFVNSNTVGIQFQD